jgi:hypothetical protein
VNSTAAIIVAGSELLTLILSMAIALFASGSKRGRLESKIDFMSDRLAKIEGMFTLKFKDKDE